MELTIRQRCQKVADTIKTNVNKSLKAIAAATGLSKSAVHRHQQAIARRNQYPESSYWETEVGHRWLTRLVLGVVYHFGIKQGVGAETLSEFLQVVHLETHIATSPTALRRLKQRMNQAILDYEAAQAQHCQPSQNQGICVGADETFFGLPILVLMELASGFIFLETEADNCSYDSWVEQLEQWWESKQWQCHYLVSDGARALIKLALSGFGCTHVADLFHALRGLGRPIGRALNRQHRDLQQHYDMLEERLNQTQEATPKPSLPVAMENTLKQQRLLEQDQQSYSAALEEISQRVHPFTIDTHQWQLDDQLARNLEGPLQSLAELAPSYGGAQAHKAIDSFRTLIPTFAQGIEAWWQWVWQALQVETPDRAIQNWVLMTLLPWVYWCQQADKARSASGQHCYQQAASQAFDLLLEQPLTLQLEAGQLEQWVHWCEEFCGKYQRTSSAVEGRYGYLSKLHHSSRGFSAQSLRALTIIHNFHIKRADGTTAAQRLFGHPFPDLFEWLLEHMGDLPLPRRSSKAQRPNPSYANAFPA